LLAHLIHPELFDSTPDDLSSAFQVVDISLLKGELTEGRDYYHPVLDSSGWWRRFGRFSNDDSNEITASVRHTSATGDLGRALLITGATGTLGQAFARLCEQRGLSYYLLNRQELDIASFRKDEGIAIPDGFAFAALPGLSTELRQKLERHRPASLGQAARLDGMTPAALMLLLAHLKKGVSAKSA